MRSGFLVFLCSGCLIISFNLSWDLLDTTASNNDTVSILVANHGVVHLRRWSIFGNLLLSRILLGSRAGQVCCPPIGCYDQNLLYFLFPLPQCPETMGISMKVFTRNNPTIGQNITREIIPSIFNGKVMTMFIVHGWNNDENTPWMHDIKDATLAQRDYNVIIVGWKYGANHLFYPESASNTRTLGGHIALVVKNIIDSGKSSKDLMYCVGHSLGAHACGQAGQRGQLFGRITGLDPAGPLYVDHDPEVGLNPSCADLVDVIHTDGLRCGLLKALGHIDFYPNGGHDQPGCFLFDVGCSHSRALDYFRESIGTPCFLSHQSCRNQLSMPVFCSQSYSVVQSMGFNATGYPGRGIFYLETNAAAPFCLG